MPPSELPTESAVWGVSKWNKCKWTIPENLYVPIRDALNEVNPSREEANKNDALIAETAIRNGFLLITNDKKLKKVVSSIGEGLVFDLLDNEASFKLAAEIIFYEVRKSFADCAIALAVVQPIVAPQPEDITKINNTPIADVCIAIRTALLHGAALGLTRITDKPSEDRVTISEVLSLLEKMGLDVQAASLLYDKIRNSEDFTTIRKIRDSRIVHNLRDKATQSLNGPLERVYTEVHKVIDEITKLAGFKSITPDDHGYWIDSGIQYWNCIFKEGDKYIPVFEPKKTA